MCLIRAVLMTLILSEVALCENTLAGHVTDWVTGEAIAAATVEAKDVHGHQYTTISSKDGGYELKGLPQSGVLDVVCRQLGYAPDPETARIALSSKKTVWEWRLYRNTASNTYWKRAAEILAGNKDSARMSEVQWAAANAPPEGRKQISSELNKMIAQNASGAEAVQLRKTVMIINGEYSSTGELAEDNSPHEVTLENRSSYNVYSLYVSSTESESWATDLLNTSILRPEGQVHLPAVRPGRYDVKLIDAYGDVCVSRDVWVDGHTVWEITDSWFLDCKFQN